MASTGSGARGARGVFALTPLEIEISGKKKPKEKVISTKSEFRRTSSHKKDPTMSKLRKKIFIKPRKNVYPVRQ